MNYMIWSIWLPNLEFWVSQWRKQETYSLSEEDTYRIKSIVHFYDYIDEDNLEELKEIKQFGIPHNYDYCPSNPQKPTKQFIKLMLIEEK